MTSGPNPNQTSEGALVMDIRKVKKLIELLEESGIGEIEIKEGEESVRISRGVFRRARQSQPWRHRWQPRRIAAPPPPRAAAAAPQAPAAAAPAPAASSARRRAQRALAHGGHASTGRRRPRPAPFVEVGKHSVKAGDVRLHRRGDEDDEPDRSRRSGTVEKSSSKTASRSSSSSPCFPSPSAGRLSGDRHHVG